MTSRPGGTCHREQRPSAPARVVKWQCVDVALSEEHLDLIITGTPETEGGIRMTVISFKSRQSVVAHFLKALAISVIWAQSWIPFSTSCFDPCKFNAASASLGNVDEGQTRTLDILAVGFMRDVIVRVHCLKQRSFTSFTGGFRGMCHVQNQSEHCTFQIHDPKKQWDNRRSLKHSDLFCRCGWRGWSQ